MVAVRRIHSRAQPGRLFWSRALIPDPIFVSLPAILLPQLIPSSLPSRHEMSVFLRRIEFFIPKLPQQLKETKSADSTPSILACPNPLGRSDTCSCRARPRAQMRSPRDYAWDHGDR